MREDTANILSILDNFSLESEEDIAKAIADDFVSVGLRKI